MHLVINWAMVLLLMLMPDDLVDTMRAAQSSHLQNS